MKTILIKAEVKTDMDLPLKFVVFEGDTLFYRCTKVELITLPTEEEMYLNMQYYMEYCQTNGYVTPQEWIEKHKHF